MKDEYGFNPAPRPISEFPFAMRPTMQSKTFVHVNMNFQGSQLNLDVRTPEDKDIAIQALEHFFDNMEKANKLASQLNIADANREVLKHT